MIMSNDKNIISQMPIIIFGISCFPAQELYILRKLGPGEGKRCRLPDWQSEMRVKRRSSRFLGFFFQKYIGDAKSGNAVGADITLVRQ